MCYGGNEDCVRSRWGLNPIVVLLKRRKESTELPVHTKARRGHSGQVPFSSQEDVNRDCLSESTWTLAFLSRVAA